MNLLKKIITAILGLQLVGCATSVNEKIDKHYVCESEFKSAYNEARKHISNGVYVKALSLLDKLEEEAYAPALYTLYELYSKGKGVKKNEEKAGKYLFRATKYGYPFAEYETSMKVLKGESSVEDKALALIVLKKLGKRLNDEESGEDNIFYKLNSKVFITLGELYYEGKYVTYDLNEAFKYSSIIGTFPPTQEYTVGRELLAKAYLLFGKVLEAREDQNIDSNGFHSFAWYSKAREMGNMEGYYYSGLLYLKEKNFEYAASSFGQGCSAGHAKSCYEAGVLYESNKVYKNGDKNEYGHVRENPLIIAHRAYKEGARLGSLKCKERLKLIENKK